MLKKPSNALSGVQYEKDGEFKYQEKLPDFKRSVSYVIIESLTPCKYFELSLNDFEALESLKATLL